MVEYTKSGNIINIGFLRENSESMAVKGLIAPGDEVDEGVVFKDHAAEPIKSLDDIDRISDYLIQNKRYRDNMLFICGINFGLRASDLRELRFSNLINENSTFKENFAIFEKKTRNTRKRKKNRYITINRAVREAVSLYLENAPKTVDGFPMVKLSDYLFTNKSNNGVMQTTPLTVYSIDRILKGVARDLDLNIHMSTHTLRKTFAYWTMVLGNNDQRQLLLLQKMFNHSSPAQTLAYIGLDADEIAEAYKSLNLGARKTPALIEKVDVRFESA